MPLLETKDLICPFIRVVQREVNTIAEIRGEDIWHGLMVKNNGDKVLVSNFHGYDISEPESIPYEEVNSRLRGKILFTPSSGLIGRLVFWRWLTPFSIPNCKRDRDYK